MQSGAGAQFAGEHMDQTPDANNKGGALLNENIMKITELIDQERPKHWRFSQLHKATILIDNNIFVRTLEASQQQY
ncbi:unnamed protein product [Ambrosiozyma monospora]|uniref:Unnamed protein product n=1 Tax=Ambrosiozyma monospora TaxID=43982 RepID=A0ACB5TV09_AMBMO|nr:unnamed protein product [Ambrosiozyma monospora]